MKKVLSIVLTMVLLLPFVPNGIFSFEIKAATDGNYTYIITDGEVTITYVDEFIIGDVIIPSSLGGYPVKSIAYKSFYGCNNITSVVIPHGVTSIGESAFASCTSLESITVPDSITSMGSEAFNGCYYLKEVNITNISAWCNIEFVDVFSNPLYSANSLYLNGVLVTDLVIPYGVESVGQYAFYYYTALESITIPDSVTSIGYNAFYECTNLKRVNITDISAWCNIEFYGYESNPLYYANKLYLNGVLVTDLVIPDGVTSIGQYAFYCYTSLASVTFPDTVKHIGYYAFQDCLRLGPDIVLKDVTEIEAHAFEGCTSLQSVSILGNTQRIGYSAFYKCASLSSINLSDNVAYIENSTFSETAFALNENNWENNVLYIEKHLICADYSIEGSYEIRPDTVTIATSAFSGCDKLTSIKIPKGITCISDYTFGNCYSLEDVYIPVSVVSIEGYAFYHCDNLKNVYYGGSSLDKEKIQIGSYNSLSHYYPEWHYADTSDKVLVYSYDDETLTATVTEHASGITVANIPEVVTYNGNTYTVTAIGEFAFYNCTELTSLSIPDSVTSIGARAFDGCTSLASVSIPSNVNIIEMSAFANCTGLQEVIFEENNDSLEIEMDAFYGCEKLTSIVIPNGTVSIGQNAFNNCIGLTSVTLPNSITYISNYSFSNCVSLTDVYYKGSFLEKKKIQTNSWSESDDGEITYHWCGELEDATWHYSMCDDSEHLFTMNENHTCEICGYSKAPNAPIIEYQGIDHVKLAYMDGFEYSIDGINWGENIYFYDLEFDREYTFYQRVKGTSDVLASEKSEGITVCVESPIQSIAFEDIVLMKDFDSYFNGEYDEYKFSANLISVVLKDGTSPQIFGSRIEYNEETYWVSYDYDDTLWIPGNTYVVTGTLLGVSSTFKVTILDNPIQELKIIKMPEKTEYIVGETFNLKGAIFRLQFTDGTYEDIVIEEDCTPGFYKRFYSEKLQRSDWLWYTGTTFSEVGNHTVEIFTLDCVKCEITVTVKENLTEVIILKESSDKSLVITVYNYDATSYEMKVLDFAELYSGEEEGTYYAQMFTDKGQFEAVIYVTDNSFSIALVNPYDGSLIKSNKLAKSDWFSVMKFMRSNVIYYLADDFALNYKYNGKLTADNIDDIIKIAYWHCEFKGLLEIPFDETDSCCIFKGEDIRRIVGMTFVLDCVDLSLSDNYDPENDTYSFNIEISIGEFLRQCPTKISYNDGVWSFIVTLDSWIESRVENVIEIKLNGERKIISFSVNEKVPTEITSSQYTIDDNYIGGIALGTTVEELLSKINEGEYCTVYKGNEEVGKNEIVGTGMVVKIVDDGNVIISREIVIIGDVDGSGTIDSTDYLRIKSLFLGTLTLDGAYNTAADADGSGKIDSTDYLRIKSYFLGQLDLYA